MTSGPWSALESHAARWAANALSTTPVAAERLVPAVHALYAAAGLRQPRVVVASSPLVMAFAGGFAAAIWWVRKNNLWARGDGLAWASGYFRREDAGPLTRSLVPALKDALRLATEQAMQPTRTHAATMDRRGDACRSTRLNRLACVEEVMVQPSCALTERSTRGTCAAATSRAHGDPAQEVVRQLTEQHVGRLTQRATLGAVRAALAQAAQEAVRAGERHARLQAVKQRLSLHKALDPRSKALAADMKMEYEELCRRLESDPRRPRDPWARQAAMVAHDLGAELGIDPLLLLLCASSAQALYQGGNMESATESYLGACRDLLGLVLPEHARYRAWEACALEGGFRFIHDEFCIVCERPEVLKVDDQNRPHCADGPSHRWRDGWSLYHWHGTHIPPGHEHLILAPEQITVAGIDDEENSELRRVMMERYGAVRYLFDCGATVVEELPADHRIAGLRSARLFRRNPRGVRDMPMVYVDLLNSTPEPDGTVRRYLLRIDPTAYDGEASRHVHAAIASTWRNADGSLTFRHWQDYDPHGES